MPSTLHCELHPPAPPIPPAWPRTPSAAACGVGSGHQRARLQRGQRTPVWALAESGSPAHAAPPTPPPPRSCSLGARDGPAPGDARDPRTMQGPAARRLAGSCARSRATTWGGVSSAADFQSQAHLPPRQVQEGRPQSPWHRLPAGQGDRGPLRRRGQAEGAPLGPVPGLCGPGRAPRPTADDAGSLSGAGPMALGTSEEFPLQPQGPWGTLEPPL